MAQGATASNAHVELCIAILALHPSAQCILAMGPITFVCSIPVVRVASGRRPAWTTLCLTVCICSELISFFLEWWREWHKQGFQKTMHSLCLIACMCSELITFFLEWWREGHKQGSQKTMPSDECHPRCWFANTVCFCALPILQCECVSPKDFCALPVPRCCWSVIAACLCLWPALRCGCCQRQRTASQHLGSVEFWIEIDE